MSRQTTDRTLKFKLYDMITVNSASNLIQKQIEKQQISLVCKPYQTIFFVIFNDLFSMSHNKSKYYSNNHCYWFSIGE